MVFNAHVQSQKREQTQSEEDITDETRDKNFTQFVVQFFFQKMFMIYRNLYIVITHVIYTG